MVLFQAVIVRPLSAVSALVRFAEEPQMFAIDFNDGCPMHVWSLSAVSSLMFINVHASESWLSLYLRLDSRHFVFS